jgi:hypothetical protein
VADEKKKAKPERPRKRTWRPPTVKTGTLFESNSLACGKTLGNEQCMENGPLSAS